MYTSLKSVTQPLFFCVLSVCFLQAQENISIYSPEISSWSQNSSNTSCCRFHKKKFKKKHRCRVKKQKQCHAHPAHTCKRSQLSTVKAKKKNPALTPHDVIAHVYANVSGNQISAVESDLIKKKGGNPTYGEIKPASLSRLLQDLDITKQDVFYDLGSGTGKVVVQSYLEFPFKKVVGIELSHDRYTKAVHALAELKKRGLIKKKRTINFIQGDIVETPYKDATVIFMCSTCFSDQLMTKLAEKIAQLKKGARIITLKRIPEPKKYKLTLVREYRLAMSWSTPEGSPVYVYQKIS